MSTQFHTVSLRSVSTNGYGEDRASVADLREGSTLRLRGLGGAGAKVYMYVFAVLYATLTRAREPS